MTFIQRYIYKETRNLLLEAEKISEEVWLHVIKIVFPATLLYYFYGTQLSIMDMGESLG